MSRKTDLLKHCEQSYNLIRQYENTLRLSSDALEKARSRQHIAEQWGYIRGYIEELKLMPPIPPFVTSLSFKAAQYQIIRAEEPIIVISQAAWICNFCRSSNRGDNCDRCGAPKHKSDRLRR